MKISRIGIVAVVLPASLLALGFAYGGKSGSDTLRGKERGGHGFGRGKNSQHASDCGNFNTSLDHQGRGSGRGQGRGQGHGRFVSLSRSSGGCDSANGCNESAETCGSGRGCSTQHQSVSSCSGYGEAGACNSGRGHGQMKQASFHGRGRGSRSGHGRYQQTHGRDTGCEQQGCNSVGGNSKGYGRGQVAQSQRHGCGQGQSHAQTGQCKGNGCQVSFASVSHSKCSGQNHNCSSSNSCDSCTGHKSAQNGKGRRLHQASHSPHGCGSHQQSGGCGNGSDCAGCLEFGTCEDTGSCRHGSSIDPAGLAHAGLGRGWGRNRNEHSEGDSCGGDHGTCETAKQTQRSESENIVTTPWWLDDSGSEDGDS